MDPLSIIVSIATLMDLALKVTKTLFEYTSSVKHAPAESSELAGELDALAKALEALDHFVAGQSTKVNSFNSTSVLYSVIHTCHGKLSSLQSILQKFMKTSEGKKWYRSVVWPFKKQEHVETISTLHRCMQIFQLSLSVDGWYVKFPSRMSIVKIIVLVTSCLRQVRRFPQSAKLSWVPQRR